MLEVHLYYMILPLQQSNEVDIILFPYNMWGNSELESKSVWKSHSKENWHFGSGLLIPLYQKPLFIEMTIQLYCPNSDSYSTF